MAPKARASADANGTQRATRKRHDAPAAAADTEDLMGILLDGDEMEMDAPASAQISQTQIIQRQAETIAQLRAQVEKAQTYKQVTKAKLKEAALRLREYRLRVETLMKETQELKQANANANATATATTKQQSPARSSAKAQPKKPAATRTTATQTVAMVNVSHATAQTDRPVRATDGLRNSSTQTDPHPRLRDVVSCDVGVQTAALKTRHAAAQTQLRGDVKAVEASKSCSVQTTRPTMVSTGCQSDSAPVATKTALSSPVTASPARKRKRSMDVVNGRADRAIPLPQAMQAVVSVASTATVPVNDEDNKITNGIHSNMNVEKAKEPAVSDAIAAGANPRPSAAVSTLSSMDEIARAIDEELRFSSSDGDSDDGEDGSERGEKSPAKATGEEKREQPKVTAIDDEMSALIDAELEADDDDDEDDDDASPTMLQTTSSMGTGPIAFDAAILKEIDDELMSDDDESDGNERKTDPIRSGTDLAPSLSNDRSQEIVKITEIDFPAKLSVVTSDVNSSLPQTGDQNDELSRALATSDDEDEAQSSLLNQIKLPVAMASSIAADIDKELESDSDDDGELLSQVKRPAAIASSIAADIDKELESDSDDDNGLPENSEHANAIPAANSELRGLDPDIAAEIDGELASSSDDDAPSEVGYDDAKRTAENSVSQTIPNADHDHHKDSASAKGDDGHKPITATQQNHSSSNAAPEPANKKPANGASIQNSSVNGMDAKAIIPSRIFDPSDTRKDVVTTATDTSAGGSAAQPVAEVKSAPPKNVNSTQKPTTQAKSESKVVEAQDVAVPAQSQQPDCVDDARSLVVSEMSKVGLSLSSSDSSSSSSDSNSDSSDSDEEDAATSTPSKSTRTQTTPSPRETESKRTAQTRQTSDYFAQKDRQDLEKVKPQATVATAKQSEGTTTPRKRKLKVLGDEKPAELTKQLSTPKKAKLVVASADVPSTAIAKELAGQDSKLPTSKAQATPLSEEAKELDGQDKKIPTLKAQMTQPSEQPIVTAPVPDRPIDAPGDGKAVERPKSNDSVRKCQFPTTPVKPAGGKQSAELAKAIVAFRRVIAKEYEEKADEFFVARGLSALLKASARYLSSNPLHVEILSSGLVDEFRKHHVTPIIVVRGSLRLFRTPRSRHMLVDDESALLSQLCYSVFSLLILKNSKKNGCTDAEVFEVERSLILECLEELRDTVVPGRLASASLAPSAKNAATAQLQLAQTKGSRKNLISHDKSFLQHVCALYIRISVNTGFPSGARVLLFDLLKSTRGIKALYLVRVMISVYPDLLRFTFDRNGERELTPMKEVIRHTLAVLAARSAEKRELHQEESSISIMMGIAELIDDQLLCEINGASSLYQANFALSVWSDWIDKCTSETTDPSFAFEVSKCMELVATVHDEEFLHQHFGVDMFRQRLDRCSGDAEGAIIRIVGRLAGVLQSNFKASHELAYVAEVLALFEDVLAGEECNLATAEACLNMLGEIASVSMNAALRSRCMCIMHSWMMKTSLSQAMALSAPVLRQLRFAMITTRDFRSATGRASAK